MNYIGVLDCNNFFVSCERLFRPDLRHQPTLVLSSNDGCVVARSQEVKDIGIPMGIPHFKIKDLIEKHNVAIFSSNFTLYRDISSRVMQVLREEVGNVEQYSIDESFFLLSGPESGLLERLQNIRNVIETKVGVPVSLGLGKTKTIAKYAGVKEKRGTRAGVLLGNSWRKLTPDISLHEIWGVGRQSATKFNQLGLTTVAELLRADRSRIRDIFGVNGLRLVSELSETPVHGMFEATELQKSIMSTRSFAKSVSNKDELKEAVTYHVEAVCEDLRRQKAVAKTLRVMLLPSRHGNWLLHGGVLEAELLKTSSDTRDFLAQAHRLVDQLFEAGVPYKKAGVILSTLYSNDHRQNGLFPDNKTKTSEVLMEVVDAVNQRFPRTGLMFGRVNRPAAWRSSRAHLSPDYTTKWTDIRSVRA